jgi:hypothetical protein
MRSCLTFVLVIAVACSGEPFTALTDAKDGNATTSAGSGAGHPAPSSPMDDAAGGSSFQGEPRAGANATSGQPGQQTGGAADAVGGAQAGDAGAASEAPECPSGATGDWELGYFPEVRDASAQESHPFFEVTNRGPTTTLDRIAIRYYFTKESDVAETAVCYWVTGDRCSLAKIDFGDVATSTPSASRYVEVSFPGASDVTVTAASLEVRLGFKTGAVALIQTNDYSFDRNAAAPSSAVPFPYKRWPQATLYLDGTLVWGTEPCASNGSATAMTKL